MDILLKSTNKISIITDDKSIRKGDKNFYILFNNNKYNGFKPYKCISDPTRHDLYPYLVKEYTESLIDVNATFEKLHTEYKPVEKPSESASLGSQLEEIMVKVLAEQSVDRVMENAKPMLKKYIIENFGLLPQKHEIITPKYKYEIQGVVHEKFDQVMNLINLDIPVFLSGPAGAGKNVICKQIAEALHLDFYFTNAVTQEYQLKGFIDANGNYHETQFFKAFTQGGLFFLDEMDGSIPETLIILNAAIANRYFDFPTGKFEAHPNFRIIAAGNTFGTGADIEYTGRFQLDAASLDRFALFNIDYSPSIENAITNGNDELCYFAKCFRQVTNKAGIHCLCTYRAIERIAKLEGMFDLHEILKISLTKGLSNDDVNIIKKELTQLGCNSKYAKAL